MAFNKEQKRAWRKRPEVRARQREHQRKTNERKRALGLAHDMPLGPRAPRPNQQALRIYALQRLGARCGIDDQRVLQIDHIIPMRRRLNKLSDNADTGVALLRRIVDGDTSNVQALCANCHVIKTIEDKAHLAMPPQRELPLLTLMAGGKG
jgi:5-methylcytosine-specific restriction endonuclease McrA